MFISFEGIDGVGKSTALEAVARRLRAQGKEVLCTREPGGSDLGKEIRKFLLDGSYPLSSQAELFLFLADRAQHVAELIRPALNKGQIVLCDRYTDSTLAYQGAGRGLSLQELRILNDAATGKLHPELTLLFDLSPEDALQRVISRNGKQERFDVEGLTFQKAVRHGFLALAQEEPERIRIVDASLQPDALAEQCFSLISSLNYT